MGLLALFGSGAAAILPGWVILVITILVSMFLTSFVGVFVERVSAIAPCATPRAPRPPSPAS